MSKNYLRYITRCGTRMYCPLAMAAIFLSAWPARAQDTSPLNRKVTVKANNQPIAVVLSEIEKQTNLNFVYDGSQINRAQAVTVRANDAALKNVLHDIFNDGVQYTIVGNQVIVKSAPGRVAVSVATGRLEQQDQHIRLRGSVSLRDSRGNLQQIPGVTVRVKGKSQGTHTDAAGKFEITVAANDVLVVSFVGYKTVEMPVKGASNIILDEDASKIKEVVVTGIYERTKESFTGSASTYTAKELKQIGNQNIIQSLRSLDPAFTVYENNLMGSNPNVMPNLEIRGKTSVLGLKEQFGTDPNQPLFILDGFETNLRTIVDLDINRVESVTILKDAASTAIYGAKAANGVIVIETKKPKPGELRVYYTTDNSITIPDLHDYNLMDAAEKLEFERISGRFTSGSDYTQLRQKELDQAYSDRLAEVMRGVNTYWLSEPVRTGFTTGHSLYAEGGDNQMRYSVGLNYKKINGAMKGSGRDIGGANVKLVYRRKKLSFNNNLSLNFFTAKESPYGSFQDFAQASPYYRKRDENGNLQPYLEQRANTGSFGADTTTNPLWNASIGNSNVTRNFSVVNNFMAEWELNRDFRVRGRLGVTKEDGKQEVYTDARHTTFLKKVPTERGSYTGSQTSVFNYDGELTAIYGKLINNRHQINAVGGWKFQQFRNTGEGYTVIGLPPGVSSPAFAAGYPIGGKSSSSETTTRSTSAYLNAGYMLDERYMADVNFRLDGSSVFGSNHFFTTSWSVGLSWNLHKEPMLQEVSWINFLKLRGSIGTPGNQNFSTYQSFTTYRYNTNVVNDFGIGAVIAAFGNPNLLWQKTLDKNIGADIILINNRLRLNIDVYNRITDPLVAQISLPSSVGTSTYLTNLGKQVGNGYNFMFSVSPWYKPQERINWSINFSAKRENAHYDNMGNSLDVLNKENRSKNLERYYDGGSPTAIWAVRSAGIDPGTGKEVLIKKDGTLTLNYDADDEVVVGDARPKLEGVAGTNFSYKGFTVGVYLRYRMGADVFNEALYDKVENINSRDILLNQDRRALYDRWKQPGDIARFRAISMTLNSAQMAANVPPMTSRFVQRENILAGESINMGYEFTNGMVKRWRMSYLRLNAYMNDIFRLSSITRERGIDYPFANTVSFSVSAGF
ncbi:SusC/RagA family TonB-linked outer membrane protein [Chitinophaga varians]|uniref:SusC/RagA family TonB-linked outer membrane protein n=1 Tax=Chitinophaga varians TaxID=2202339 RepID=UPI00165ED96A|nr:SusC/RagA family TonB-linked outer membrane protein [Chitinophaga varians]MBC9911525.1 SusC/RagA family TonB-linked outer membrane protein [Chitinophaga varians]